MVVVDNVACGPAIGGVRMAPDVTVEEVVAAGPGHDPQERRGRPAARRRRRRASSQIRAAAPRRQGALVRSVRARDRGLTEYIPGPDMGTNEACMAWISDEIGRAVGLPRVLGGIPLDEIGATGFGLAVAAEVAAAAIKLHLTGRAGGHRGIRAVGQHAARFLAQRGARLVAATDSRRRDQHPAASTWRR